MKIVLASRNKHKIGELQTMLREHIADIEILSLDDVGITEEIEENGESFQENSLIKARAAASSGYIGVGDDSGLEVFSLGGEPGIYSARYAGEHGNDAANNALLLSRLEGKADRRARFVCAISCVFPDGHEDISVLGTVEGVILDKARGEGGFGYDPLFYYPPLDKSFGELAGEEKNLCSHRRRAIEKLAKELDTIYLRGKK